MGTADRAPRHVLPLSIALLCIAPLCSVTLCIVGAVPVTAQVDSAGRVTGRNTRPA